MMTAAFGKIVVYMSRALLTPSVVAPASDIMGGECMCSDADVHVFPDIKLGP